jgi:hypothetical protein
MRRLVALLTLVAVGASLADDKEEQKASLPLSSSFHSAHARLTFACRLVTSSALT